jgi:AGZA family xanthine/uracil permease-like MFS transporter
MFETIFQLSANRTTVKTEVIAGITTFLTMAYIVFVNPAILSEAGMDRDAVFMATCLAAAIGTAIMGLYANYPIALAPGMGLNAYFTYGVVLGMGFSWQVALGAVFFSGVLFLLLSVFRTREWIINAIPRSLKLAVSAGIGMFLAIIALKNAGIVQDHPATLLTVGDLTQAPALLAVAGFVVIIALEHRRIPGAIIIGILIATSAGIALGVSEFNGIVASPPSMAPTLLQLDLAGAFQIGLVTIVFAFLFVDLFDTAGTLIGIAHRAGFLDEQGRLPRIRKALVADSVATMAGAVLGTSTTTSYIESAAGVNAGGRTGLTAVTVAVLFLAAIVLSPLATTIPAYATAPALLFVACIMARGLSEVDWDDVTEYVPAVVTAFAMPFTFSIATGIGFGFISYAAIKLLSGRFTEAHPAVLAIAAAFCVKFAVL